MNRSVFGIAYLAFALVSPARGGVFLDLHNTAPLHDTITIVHPLGYTGAGGPLPITICVEPSAPPAVQVAVDQAIATWNALQPMTGNCIGCLTLLEPTPNPPPIPVTELFHTVLHELGHCAMGLDHPNWLFDPMTGEDPSPTDFTAGRTIQAWLNPDGVPGSQDDRPLPFPGPQIIHWYRSADNNPVIVDGTVIDSNTYSRALGPLAGMGQFWPANANRLSAALLGAQDAQTIMYAEQSFETTTLGLVADEVNTVRFAASGLDKLANTADDYQVVLSSVASCDDAVVRVGFEPMAIEKNGDCMAAIEEMPVQPDPTPQHYVVTQSLGESQLRLRINSLTVWDFSLVFFDSFESGDTSEWDSTIP